MQRLIKTTRFVNKKIGTSMLFISGVSIASAYLFFTTKQNSTGFYNKGYNKMKFKIPPYNRIIEDLHQRDYEIPILFNKELTEKPHGDNLMVVRMEKFVLRLQHKFATVLSIIENENFDRDEWRRKDNSGGGVVKYFQGGNYIEKGGVNVSVSKGELNTEAQKQMIEKSSDIKKFLQKKIKNNQKVPFRSVSISSVIHPKNPHAATLHFNYRYFEIGEYDNNRDLIVKHCWFGGGCDLTPSILYEEDAKHFHGVYRKICEKHEKGRYERMKRACDDYFYIPYRGEHRGVGGVFFDELTGTDPEKNFEFIEEMGQGVLEAYIPILLKRIDLNYNYQQRNWQLNRRGRYAEFNTAIDRGTKFGRSRENANIEAIHISLPLNARFDYNRRPESEQEKRLMEVLKNPINWADN